MALHFYASFAVVHSKVLLLVILLKIGEKNKYGSKCLKLPNSLRNAKKNLVALSKVSLIRALLNVFLLTTL